MLNTILNDTSGRAIICQILVGFTILFPIIVYCGYRYVRYYLRPSVRKLAKQQSLLRRLTNNQKVSKTMLKHKRLLSNTKKL